MLCFFLHIFSIGYLVFIKSKIITKRQLLLVVTKKKCLERAKLLLSEHFYDTQPTVLWTDEKLFTVQANNISPNYWIWTKIIESVPAELRTSFRWQKPALFRVRVEVTSSGLETPLAFVEDGVKINHLFISTC